MEINKNIYQRQVINMKYRITVVVEADDFNKNAPIETELLRILKTRDYQAIHFRGLGSKPSLSYFLGNSNEWYLKGLVDYGYE